MAPASLAAIPAWVGAVVSDIVERLRAELDEYKAQLAMERREWHMTDDARIAEIERLRAYEKVVERIRTEGQFDRDGTVTTNSKVFEGLEA